MERKDSSVFYIIEGFVSLFGDRTRRRKNRFTKYNSFQIYEKNEREKVEIMGEQKQSEKGWRIILIGRQESI